MTLQSPATGIPADLEAKLWAAVDKLRGHLDAAEYKNVVLGLIFLKDGTAQGAVTGTVRRVGTAGAGHH